jgi:maltooligosyltrehalose trehalohydrolase
MEMTSFAFQTSWGATTTDDGAKFRLWAPDQPAIELVCAQTEKREKMQREDGGWFSLETSLIPADGGYWYGLPDGKRVPDPAARAQVGDVHGPSKLVASKAFSWVNGGWKGRPWEEVVIYELHTGTFTEEGTFEGIRKRLDYLQALGVTAIELMPIAQFGGTRGWGYDGVLLYAPHNVYGSTDDLKRLIDEAHGRGLMVFLDVVYNHFGPDGNYLNLYASQFFHQERKTPWGSAIAYDEKAVRSFLIENAMYWLEEYRFDGLRLDAVDQIGDVSSDHLLNELASVVRARIRDRHIHLATEDDRNIVSLHGRDDAGAPKLYSGEWNDDFHHVVHALATGESDGYYMDYADDAEAHLCTALTEGFVYQGQASPFRDGEHRGEPSNVLPPSAFVNFLQNHDQIGNRAFGERLSTLIDGDALDALLALLLLSPFTPLFFMGDEWGETRPFLYFTDFDGELGKAVREGRRNEFRKWRAFADPSLREKIPDPNDPKTADASRIDWSQSKSSDNRVLKLVRELLALRQEKLVPKFAGMKLANSSCRKLGDKSVSVTWLCADGSALHIFLNLGDQPVTLPEAAVGELIFSSAADAGPAAQVSTLAKNALVAFISNSP